MADGELAELFDNESLWEGDDTDELLLQLVDALERRLAVPAAEMRDAGRNSLAHLAAIHDRPRTMEAMIRRGLDLNARNTNGDTALDLAAHYGHADLAQQLRHYGAKHTCECDRDLAIAERDGALAQIRECEAERDDALRLLKQAKREREQLRVERDRLAEAHATVTAARDGLVADKARVEDTLTTLTTSNQRLLLELAQLREALACEQSTRQNAVQSWQGAQRIIEELQTRELTCREREEEAVRMRQEALQDRDVARELTRLAQLDQGLAKQAQVEAEREREAAVRRQLEAEAGIEAERAVWSKKIAKTELERRNIQIEIDRQTSVLRTECDRLEKQVAGANAAMGKLREELTRRISTADQLAARTSHFEDQIRRLERDKATIDARNQQLLQERREEHKTWRTHIETTVWDAVAGDLQRMLQAALPVWEQLKDSHGQFLVLDNSGLQEALKPMLAGPLDESETTPIRRELPSPRDRPPTVLPFLPDRPYSPTVKMSSSIPCLATVSSLWEPSPDGAPIADDAFRFEYNARVDAEAQITRLRSRLGQPERLDSGYTADEIVSLCCSIRDYLGAITDYVSRNMRHFRFEMIRP